MDPLHERAIVERLRANLLVVTLLVESRVVTCFRNVLAASPDRIHLLLLPVREVRKELVVAIQLFEFLLLMQEAGPGHILIDALCHTVLRLHLHSHLVDDAQCTERV